VKKGSKNKRIDRLPKPLRRGVEAELLALAKYLKRKREAKGLTQEGLAGLLNVETTTVQAIKQMRSRPSLELLVTIVKALHKRIVLN